MRNNKIFSYTDSSSAGAMSSSSAQQLAGFLMVRAFSAAPNFNLLSTISQHRFAIQLIVYPLSRSSFFDGTNVVQSQKISSLYVA
ncbi:hypothetical protein MST22_00440 [Virgibacillus halodenitrificans]|uniref:hypothetical protein n=1 Tax=Virgibacillus halodenitrificans TaxID=1482 RepID=UPI001FB42C34|nr:hypothetical protein [Virgibacillus halodenitrificans]MCJ0929626.1 hypothetical protein [Virgibacillus halodenitrificans]